MSTTRTEHDSLGPVEVPADKLWGAQTQRSIGFFSISNELIPRELIPAYALIKKASASVNADLGLLEPAKSDLIRTVCDELLAGGHADQFPLHVWMTGSGTQFNMNVNEVISNRCSQIAGEPLGSHKPVHPNDDVNKSQSSNDTFPAAMSISAAVALDKLLPAVRELRDALKAKSEAWRDVIKIGRTHLQDATPLTLGQEFSGFAVLLDDNIARLEAARPGVCELALGGTAVGTGINAPAGFDVRTAECIAGLTGLPFVTAPNKFAAQGSHDAMVQLSATLKTLAVSLFKIANDIRLLACGPRCGIGELILPANEPGSSIMPGKVNPTQCEALSMLCAQVIANDTAVAIGGSGGFLQMNVYKPLIIHNLLQSLRLLTGGCTNFRRFLVEGLEPDRARIAWFLERSLMLVTALSPAIGYDKASAVAHHAMEKNLSLREAALELGAITAADFDRLVDPSKMLHPLP